MALSSLHHVIDLAWMQEAYRLTRKDAFYWYKANWTTTPFVYITSRRWTARTAATTTVKVYATTDSVTLTLNGTSPSLNVNRSPDPLTFVKRR